MKEFKEIMLEIKRYVNKGRLTYKSASKVSQETADLLAKLGYDVYVYIYPYESKFNSPSYMLITWDKDDNKKGIYYYKNNISNCSIIDLFEGKPEHFDMNKFEARRIVQEVQFKDTFLSIKEAKEHKLHECIVDYTVLPILKSLLEDYKYCVEVNQTLQNTLISW